MPASVFSLSQNYPNPWSEETQIDFSLETGASVRLDVYTTVGQFVRTYSLDCNRPGTHSLLLRRDDLPPGLYFYKLTAGTQTAIRHMVVLR
ncbi:MAG: hypothetical protein CL946_12920 [Ectothiorhodospiraceae bacterium]|nr:hypothetical protein [Ectothiorhodospiraceae bacterium]